MGVLFAVMGCISFVTIVLFAVFSYIRYRKKRIGKQILSSLQMFTLGIFLSAFFMFVPIIITKAEYSGEILPVRILVAVHSAFKLFILDGEFDVVEKATAVIGCGLIRTLFKIFAVLIYVTAPILTFGNVLSLFNNIKNEIRFMWHKKRPFYIFSELNERSVSLAEGVFSDTADEKPIIVFTDVFPKNEEDDYELLLRAYDINAIIFKKDISRINLGKKKSKIRFFLMDNDEIGNLQILSGFRNIKKIANLKSTDEIYVFGKENRCNLAVNSIKSDLKAILQDSTPSIIIVDGIRQLIFNLLINKPLFSAKTKGNSSSEKQLSIVIIGSGEIGTEMFLNTYWCGQILNYKLHITVISKESEKDFVSKINHINPDIFETAKEKSDLLDIYGDKTVFSPVYFTYNYIQTDIRADDIYSKMLNENGNCNVADADYFLVALGTDNDNMEIADMIGRFVSTQKFNSENKVAEYSVPIAYAIFDDELNRSLKNGSQKDYRFVDMFPFASLSETYKYDNITFKGIKEAADSINTTYNKAINSKLSKDTKYFDDAYSYWADVARAIHIQYKAFSTNKTVEEYKAFAKKEYIKYKAENVLPDEKLSNALAWLEHRRWNAFMRSNGFRKPSLQEERGYISLLPDVDKNSSVNKSKHKSIPLKLHPCLVESSDYGKRKDVYTEEPGFKYDLLDKVSQRIKSDYPNKHLKEYDFKEYDYSRDDFNFYNEMENS